MSGEEGGRRSGCSDLAFSPVDLRDALTRYLARFYFWGDPGSLLFRQKAPTLTVS